MINEIKSCAMISPETSTHLETLSPPAGLQATTTYLIFSLHDSLYGMDALAVREILSLPELTPLHQAPPHVLGVVNLRGRVLPVLDLSIRLGHAPQRCRVTDSIIIVEHTETLIGIMVNAVHDVRQIAAQDVEPAPSYGGAKECLAESCIACLHGVAKIDEDIVLLLRVDGVLQADELTELAQEDLPVAPAERRFCPDATAEERLIFQERARALMRPIESRDFDGQVPLAVVSLSGEYFGIDLELVREFASVQNVVPVPCSPEHIVGQMNLRGDILTLVDIRPALQLSADGASDVDAAGKVVVAEVGELRVGVLVDQVLDVFYLRPSEMTPAPAAAQALGTDYLKGTAAHGTKMLGVLDLSRILTTGDHVAFDER